MKKMPALRDVREIINNNNQAAINGEWVPCRPIPFWPGISLFRRLKYAWYVFIGKYDALKWPGQ